METFIPTPTDLAFCKSVVRVLKDGGVWIAPKNGHSYRVDHQHHTLTLEGPVTDDEMHEQSRIAFGQIGYEVKP